MKSLTVPFNVFKALTQAFNKKDSRPICNGVHFVDSILSATDGHVLCLIPVESTTENQEFNFSIKSEDALMLLKSNSTKFDFKFSQDEEGFIKATFGSFELKLENRFGQSLLTKTNFDSYKRLYTFKKLENQSNFICNSFSSYVFEKVSNIAKTLKAEEIRMYGEDSATEPSSKVLVTLDKIAQIIVMGRLKSDLNVQAIFND